MLYSELFGTLNSADKYKFYKDRETARASVPAPVPVYTGKDTRAAGAKVDAKPRHTSPRGLVCDMDYYDGQTVADSYRVLLGKRVTTRADVIARYKSIRGRLFQALRATNTADKILAVCIKRGRVSIVAAIVCIYSGRRVVWHDVTVTGKLGKPETLPNLTSKLPARVISARIKPVDGFNVETYVERVI